MKIVCAVLIWALGVYSASCFGLPNIPLNIGDSQHSAQVSVSGDGIGVTEHKEVYSEDKEHSESHSKSSHEQHQKDGSSTHVRQDSAESDQVHDSSASHSETEDRGVALGLSEGLQVFDNKKNVDDKKTFDQESGRNRSMSQDETASSKHNESSGSEYARTRESSDQHVDYDNKRLSLGGGDGLFNHQSGSTDSHNASEQESGSRWSKMKDYKHDGNRTSISSMENSAKYSKASKESSMKETQEDNSTNVHQNSGNDASNQNSGKGQKNGIDPSEILKLIHEETHKLQESSKLNSTVKPQNSQSNFAQDYLKALRESIFNTDSTQKPNRQNSGNTTHGNTVKAKTNTSSHYANLLAISSLYNKPEMSVPGSSNRPIDIKARNSDVDLARVKYDVYNNKSAITGNTDVSNKQFDGSIKDMVKKRRHFKRRRGYGNAGLATNDTIDKDNDNITLATSNDDTKNGNENITLGTLNDNLNNVHDKMTLAESNDDIINDYDNSTLARSNDSIHSDDENYNTEIKKIRHASNKAKFGKVDDSHLSQPNISEPEEDIDTSHGTNKQNLYESATPLKFSKGYVNAQHSDVDNRNKHNVSKIEEEKEEDDSLKVIAVNAQSDGILMKRENLRNNSQNIDANNSTQATDHHKNNNHSLEPDSHSNPEYVSKNEQMFQKVYNVPDIETETLSQDAVDTGEDVVKELNEDENDESTSNIRGKVNLPNATGRLHDKLENGQEKNNERSENDEVNKKTAINKSNRDDINDNDQVSKERNYDIEDIDYTSEEVQQRSSKTKNSTELNSSEERMSYDDSYEEMYNEDSKNIMNEEEQTIKNESSELYSNESERNVTIAPETVTDSDKSTNDEIYGKYTGANMNDSDIVGVDDGALTENDYKDLDLNITSTTKSINIKEISKRTDEQNSSVENDNNVPVSGLDTYIQYEGTNKTKEGDHIDQNS